MKRISLITFLLATSVAFAQYPQQQQQQPANSLDPHPLVQPTNPNLPVSKPLTPEQTEANGFAAASKITDPAQKCSALEDFFNNYPNSNMKNQGLSAQLTACQQSDNSSMTEEIADKLLAISPNNPVAMEALRKIRGNVEPVENKAKPALPVVVAKPAIKDAKGKIVKPPDTKKEVPAEPKDEGPPPMDSLPAVAPQVTFENGKVTVVASNSNLFETVKAVAAASGIRLIRNGQANEERVSVMIGPAIAREVLLALLTGSHYDFIMMGAGGDADKVDRLEITPKIAPITNANAGGDAAGPNGQPSTRTVVVEDSDDSEGFAPPPPPARPNVAPDTPITPRNNQASPNTPTPVRPTIPRGPGL